MNLKKWLAALVAIMAITASCILVFGAAGNKEETKVLIAYFTRADNTIVENPSNADVDAISSASLIAPGNTAQMASWISEAIEGDLFSIRVTEPYPQNYDKCLLIAEEEIAANKRPAISGQVKNMDDYDVIFLGYPIWGYTSPMAVLTFLESYDLSGKTIIPFCAHGTGGISGSIEDITAILPDSNIIEPFALSRDEMANGKEQMTDWIKGLALEPLL